MTPNPDMVLLMFLNFLLILKLDPVVVFPADFYNSSFLWVTGYTLNPVELLFRSSWFAEGLNTLELTCVKS